MIKQNPIEPRDTIIRKLQTFLAKGQKARALLHLEKLIEFDGGLFSEFDWIKEERRLGWLIRLDLVTHLTQKYIYV